MSRRLSDGTENAGGVIAARQLWEDIEPDLRQFVQDRATELTEALRNRMKETGKSAIEEEKDRFRLRLKEVEAGNERKHGCQTPARTG